MRAALAMVFGLLFGAGLQVSGMTDPARIIGFLDVAGRWNPALAFVMAGAILVTLPAFAFARRRQTSVLGDRIELPDRLRFDRGLIVGSAIFGLGWGLAGICPGPGVVLLGYGLAKAGLFVGAVLAGAWLVSAARLLCASTGQRRTTAAAVQADG
jgi:uncharacterized membrane protein YedE/YeeE